MKKYRLINSVLGGVYSDQVGNSDEEAILKLEKSLKNQGFKEGIEKELKDAFLDQSISWAEMLNENEVGYFDEEKEESEAREFVKEMLWDVVFKKQ